MAYFIVRRHDEVITYFRDEFFAWRKFTLHFTSLNFLMYYKVASSSYLLLAMMFIFAHNGTAVQVCDANKADVSIKVDYINIYLAHLKIYK